VLLLFSITVIEYNEIWGAMQACGNFNADTGEMRGRPQAALIGEDAARLVKD
jgi:hypothetical protein